MAQFNLLCSCMWMYASICLYSGESWGTDRLNVHKQKLYRCLLVAPGPGYPTLSFPSVICCQTLMRSFPFIYKLPCSAWNNQSITKWTWHSARLQTRQPGTQCWPFLQGQGGRWRRVQCDYCVETSFIFHSFPSSSPTNLHSQERS